MGMAVFMKTVEEAQGKLSRRDGTAKKDAVQGGLSQYSLWGPLPGLLVGLGQGRGRSPALWHLQLFTYFPQGSCPMSEN